MNHPSFHTPNLGSRRYLGLMLSNLRNFWAELLKGGERDRPSDVVFAAHRSIRVLADYLPKFVETLKRDTAPRLESNQLSKDGIAKLSVILIEERDVFSSPQRTVLAINSINDLYEGMRSNS